MTNIIIEACCGSASDVYAAKSAGADRVELNSALFFGGLTPSIGEMLACAAVNIPKVVMIRPRPGGFVYSDMEKKAMLYDIEALIEAGASGIAFGCLNDENRIDVEFVRTAVRVANGKECVFHRAFDMLDCCWRESLNTLIDLGIKRVLTSGHCKTALLGAVRLCEIIEYAQGRIEILVCGGIRQDNVSDILDVVKCSQIHTSGGMLKNIDKSALVNAQIAFTSCQLPDQGEYLTIDERAMRKFVFAVRSALK